MYHKKCGTEIHEFKQNNFGKIMFLFSVFGALCIVLSFKSGNIPSGIIASLMTVLFIVSSIMGIQTIGEKKKDLRILAAVMAFLLIVPYFSIFRQSADNIKKYKWQDIVLGEMLPEPSSNVTEIISNSESELMIYIHQTSVKQYSAYIKECKEMGYSKDSTDTDSSYTAFNQNGYKVSLSYDRSNKKIFIGLNAPMKTESIEWPDSDIAKLLPVPKSSVGNIYWENSNGFVIFVAETTIDNFKEYTELCSKNGFSIHYQKGDRYYYADNTEGCHLSLNYKGFNIMCIHIVGESGHE